MTIESNRTLGGISALLFLIGAVSQITSLFQYTFPNSIGIAILSGIGSVFGFVSFVGLILFLVAMYGFSKDYKEPKIFNNLIYGIIITIVAAIVAVAILVVVILLNLTNIFPNLSSAVPSSPQISSTMSKILNEALPIFSLIGIIWIAFNVLSLNLLADKSKVLLFRTGAKILLAGAIVNIVIAIISALVGFYVAISFNALLSFLLIGGFVQDVAWLLLAMAYFRIQAPTVPVPTVIPQSITPAPGQVKYCSNCGAPNQLDAAYCARCGQKL